MSSSEPPKGLFANARYDLPASVVVFLVAVPLCLGIALASGAPMLSGMIAGIVGGIVVGSLSGSALGVAGPAAGLAVIVLNAIQDLGSFQIFTVAVMLAGGIQILLGLIRAGVIAYYFPSAVITGMLTGIGIVIFLKQIPHALGYDKDPEGDFAFQQLDGETVLSEMGKAVSAVSVGPLLIAVISMAILLLWESSFVKKSKALSLVPGPLLAVVLGTVLGQMFMSNASFALQADQFVAMPVMQGLGDIAGILTFPDFSALSMPIVYKTAIVLAVVASLETLLSVEATDKLDPMKRVTPTNRELRAQGVGNVISGFLGGLPVTQVIVRSSANVQSGAKSKLSAVSHGILLLTSVVALSSVMNKIPLATLAAVLLLVGYKLAKPALFRKMWREGRGQFIPFIATVGGVVFIDLLVGIGFGLAIAIGGILMDNFRLAFQRSNLDEEGERIEIKLAQEVTFLNKASILKGLNELPDNTVVEIDATGSHYVHADVVEIIDNFVTNAPSRGIDVVVRGLGHNQKGEPTAGAEVTVERPSQQMDVVKD